MAQDLLAQFDDDKKTGGEVDLFELAGIDYQPPKPKLKEHGLFSTLAEVLSDGGKRASGAGVAGVASIPVAVQSSARAGIRSGASGEPSTVMPGGVFIPGIDTDEAINGPMDDAEKAKRELAAERLALKVKVPYAEAIAKAGKDTQEDINKTTSQATQEAVANSQITGNLLKGEIDFGKNPSARGLLMQGADVVGSMFPTVATALITRSPGAAGAVGGAMAAGEGVGNARDFIAKQTHEQLLEHSPIYKRMVDAGASPEEARAITSARAEDTAALMQGAVASVGDRFTGKLVTGGFDKLLTRAAGKSVLGRGAAGAAVSGLEGGGQELGEGIASDLGIKSVAGNKEVGEDSAANFVLGALGGSAPGAGRGVVSGVKDRLADRAAGKQTGDAATSPSAPAALPAAPAPAAPASSSTEAVSPAPAQPQADGQAAAGTAGQTQQAPAGVPEEVARAQNPDGAPETMSPELAETRLAELELEASTTGLNPVQDAERQALAERVAVDRAQELDAEAIGVPVDQVSAPGAEQGAARAAAENEAAPAPAPAPAAGVESAAKESTARTWPQFVLEQGERVSELKKGTPRWNELKVSWDALKISRAGQDSEGTGAAGEPKTEIQNRDRSRPASIIQMQGMAGNPDYMRLGVSRSPESGAPMVFAVGDQAQASVATGRGDTAVMSDGQRVPFQYAVMEAADVQPSNFADGAVNPLFDSAHPGTVKALNNGRTAGLRAAYERGTAEGYKRELIADSDMHGIDPAVIEGMKAPMLVRVYSEGDNRMNMGAKSQSQALGLSASEQAATDAMLMDNSVVDAFATGALDSAANRDFARAFIGKLQAAGQDVAGMMDANGALSPAGVTRLQAGLVHKAYGDGDLVESLFGSTDNDIRAIGEALKDVAGEWANLRSSVEAGAINPEVDVTANLLQAIRVVQKARRERGSLHDAINQVDMVTGDVLDPLTVGMLRLLYTGHYLTRATGRERLTESLREYMAAALATSAGGDMFGEQIGPAEILNALSAAPAQPQNEPTPARQDQSPTPQSERVATGSDPAGSRADEAGQPAPGQEPGGARPSAAETGRRSEWQDAQDPGGQQDRQGAEGLGQNSSGTVEVRGDELGEGLTGKALREAAKTFARTHLAEKQVHNLATGQLISLPWQGLKHATSNANDPELRLIPALPDLLQKATLQESVPDRAGRPDIVAAHRYTVQVILNGEPLNVGIVVREFSNGHRFYDHFIVGNKKPTGISEATSGVNQKLGVQPAVGSGDILSHVQEHDNAPTGRGDSAQANIGHSNTVLSGSHRSSATQASQGQAPMFSRSTKVAAQIETPAFKQWYGDWQNAAHEASKNNTRADSAMDAGTGAGDLRLLRAGQERVDANADRGNAGVLVVGNAATFNGTSGPTGEGGTPLRLYHGTRDDIASFDVKHPNRKDHGWLGHGVYLTNDDFIAGQYAQQKRGKHGPIVMPLYANVRNPYVATRAEKLQIRDGGPAASEAFTARVKAQGHDGVVMDMGEGAIELVAFQPEQVKSATGNNGGFNPSNPDIRFSRSSATQQTYEARIDALFSGQAQKDSRTGVRVLDRSDMLAFLGMGDGPVSLAESKVNAAKHPNMTAEVWKKIPQWLDNPAAVFDSATVQGRLVMIAPELVDGAPVLMVVEPQKGGMQVHLLQNAYDKDDSPPPVGRWLREGLAHYVNQKEFPAILQQSGLQLSSSAWQNKPGTRKILTEKNFSGYLKANPSAATESPLVAQGKGPKLSRGESGKQESTAPLDRAGLQLPRKEPQRVPGTDEILSENNQGDLGLGVAADADTDRDSARVRRVVDGFVQGWANAPEVIVTSDMQDAKVPKVVRDYDAAMRSDGAEGVPEGFYYQGKVYLVASQLHTPMDVVRVLFHETLGHHGLKHVFGAQLDPILQQLASQRAAQVKKKATEYGLNMADHAQRSMAAEEVLAEMAQTHPELGYVKRAIAAVRQWLRKNVPALANMQLTDADIIHSFIIPAREFVVRGQESAAQSAGETITFSRAQGGRAFGKGNDTVVADFLNDQPLKRHPDYKAAKAGDAESAVQVVRELVKPESLVQAQEAFGSDVIYVSVHAQEVSGKNKLPNALAMHYASSTSAYVDQDIKQTNKAFHTGAGPMERLMNRAEFAGSVAAGRRYVLVDDVTTMGSTLADIAAYIHRNGGQVAGSVVMVNAMRGGKIAPDSKTIKQLEARHGQAIREILGVDADQLTGPEAQYLIGFKSADEIRNRGARARQERVARLDAKVLSQRQAGVSQKKLESAGESDTPAFSRAPNKLSTSSNQPATNSKLAQLQAKARSLLDPSKVDTWLYHWQDKFIDLKRIQEQIKALNGTVSETNDAYRGEELYHKRVAKRAANFLRDEVRPLMKAMNDAGVGIEEFERYLHARHAAEANKAMAERNPSQQELVAKRATADQTVTDLRNQLQRAQAQGLATVGIQKGLGQALIEKADWDGAQAFNGTEDQRLSLSGMSDQEAAKILASYTGDAKKAIEDLGARIDKMNEGTLRTLDDYGLMDKATLNTWRNAYQHYVPLHRDEANPDSKAHPIGQGFSTKGDAAKKRTGSNEKVTNILSHIVMQREAALTRGEKNNVVKRLYLLAAQNPDASLWGLDLPKKKVLDPDTGLVRTMADPSARLKDSVVAFRVGGKDKYLVFNERNERAARLALAVKNMDATELDWLSRTMGHATRWMAAVNTQYNPVFSVFNIMRDLQGASLQLSDTKLAGKQKDVLANIAKNTGKIWAELRRERKEEGAGTGPWAQLMEQFQLDGGTTGFRELYSDPADRLKAMQKELRKGTQGAADKGASFALGVLSDFNESLEMTTRLATYKVALDNGLSRQEAASLAKNITVNFNRKGRVTSVLGSHYAFLNAAIQGNARLLQTMTGPAGRKIALGGVGLGVMMALMGQLMMGGGDGADDEWKKIPEFVKERNIIIPLSRTQYVTIPMPLGFHVLPNLGRKMVDAAFHNDPTVSRAKYVGDMAAIALNAYNPFGGSDNMMQMFTPTWADPAIALATNKDWMGKSIFKEVRDINHPTPGHARVKDATALPYRWAARGINAATGGSEWEQGAISPTPEAIQYLVEQAFGGVLREANKLGATATAAATREELAPHQWFLAGRVYGNTTGMNGQSGTYYDNTKRINVALAEAKARVERGENVDAVLKEVPLAKAAGVEKLADKRVSDLTKLRRKVQAIDAPDKKDQIKAINKEIEGTMRLLNQAVSDAVK